jgi:hypothetical protein
LAHIGKDMFFIGNVVKIGELTNWEWFLFWLERVMDSCIECTRLAIVIYYKVLALEDSYHHFQVAFSYVVLYFHH